MSTSIINTIRQRCYLSKLRKGGIEIVPPIHCTNFNNLILQSPCYIGDSAWLPLRGKLYIGRGTIIGPRLKVHTSNHRYEGTMLPYDDIYEVKDVSIGPNCWLGADVSIMPGVRIGEGAVVAACSCITKDVPDFAIVGGCPAKVIKFRNIDNYKRLKEKDAIYLDCKRKGLTKISDIERCIVVDKNK